MRRPRSSPLFAFLVLTGFVAGPSARSQSLDIPEALPVHPATPSDDRILGVIPNYQTVSDPNKAVKPLTVREKWKLAIRESVDPYSFVSAALGAALSQAGNDTPKYGNGFAPYMQRFGAANADLATQSLFSDGLLASLFHEDPRYFRKGPGSPVLARVWYSMTRLVVTRRDSGRSSFNFSGVLGMGMGIALSNAYYPAPSVNGSVVGSRFVTSLTGASLGNLLPEFWPDFKQKFFKRKP
ncbi:MAG: hypothetical protein M3Z23_02545 [Acidobacteriota bacterium]|nr:hypothetical protein [Acidobacteriota bacterium]